MRTPQHDGRREPVLLDVLAECVQLIGRHEREQLGRGVDLQYVAPAFGHAAPPRWRRTDGESSPVFSPVFGGVLRFLVPFRSLLARRGFSTDPRETPIPSAFPSVSDGARK